MSSLDVDPVPENYISFVYIDYHLKNASFYRILKNIENRNNVIRIVADENAECAHGTYRLRVSSCTQNGIAEAISTIVNTFRATGKLMHPDDISDTICGRKVVTPKRLSYNMSYDICALMSRRNANRPIINDCTECI